MTEDFALIDFALVARPPADLAEAIGRSRASLSAGESAPDAPRRGGLIGRLFGRGKDGGRDARRNALRLQPAGTLPEPPLARTLLADQSGCGAASPVRLSGPLGVAGLTLIEFREADASTSRFCEALSAALGGDEIFYFRHSGSLHPGAHFAFHVYRDGRATRRAESVSMNGTAPEADWHATDSGMTHPLETDAMSPPGTPKSDIMTPVRQAIIIEALGIDPEMLFEQGEGFEAVVLELSDDPAGLPLSEVRSVIAEQKRAGAPRPVAQPGEPFEAPAAVVETEPELDTSGFDPSWEEEVTGLLVAAVEAALPPEEQVAWLDALTEQLLGGDIDGALEEAQRVIDVGHRSDAVKRAAVRRLTELFGRGG
ncbi:hypothetical protein [Tropicimonas sp. IMCC6043]|uniref:hypothetical protein n=1 Tax=Tropicimonas sp. IMCC6043 TaxID=2510645 RepID=UPI00101BDB25|nr:hypothetical protein [Tropicimonas sp. IMCC6043]RYH12137.1 hypothetical protein EU800_00815 [Tropicimonas sp. IMCC6043]